MRLYLAIALGSGIGGVMRFLLAILLLPYGRGGFPVEIFAINLAGSFLVGLLATLTAMNGRWPLSLAPRQLLLAGFCGGFTTFSFFSLQTMELIRNGAWVVAMQYSAVTLVGALAAVWLGHWVANRC